MFLTRFVLLIYLFGLYIYFEKCLIYLVLHILLIGINIDKLGYAMSFDRLQAGLGSLGDLALGNPNLSEADLMLC